MSRAELLSSVSPRSLEWISEESAKENYPQPEVDWQDRRYFVIGKPVGSGAMSSNSGWTWDIETYGIDGHLSEPLWPDFRVEIKDRVSTMEEFKRLYLQDWSGWTDWINSEESESDLRSPARKDFLRDQIDKYAYVHPRERNK